MDFDTFLIESDFLNKKKYEIKIDTNTGELKVMNKPITLTYDKNEMDKNLMNKESIDFYHFIVLNFQVNTKTKA